VTLVFHTYTDVGCTLCDLAFELHQRMSGHNYTVFHDLREGRNALCYRRIIDLLAARDSWIRAEVPLTGVFLGGVLRAVVVGRMPEEAWESINEEAVSRACKGRVAVYALEDAPPVMVLREALSINLLSEMLTQASGLSELGRVNFPELPPVVVAALDAVNICELNAFLLMLTFVLLNAEKEKARSKFLRMGVLFTAGVFPTHLAMGLGLARAVNGFQWLR